MQGLWAKLNSLLVENWNEPGEKSKQKTNQDAVPRKKIAQVLVGIHGGKANR